jgi:glutathione S-transferase
MMKLYGTPPTRVLRVIWLLNELGLEYEQVPVALLQGEHYQPDFLALNPAARVPVLVDGDQVITESAAIQLYLAEKYPQAGFIPSAVEERAQMYRWIFFLMTEIEPPLWRIARHTFLYPDEKRIPQDVDLARQECSGDAGSARAAHAGARVRGRRPAQRRRLQRRLHPGLGERRGTCWAMHRRLSEYLKTMYARPTAPPTIAVAFAAMGELAARPVRSWSGYQHREPAIALALGLFGVALT